MSDETKFALELLAAIEQKANENNKQDYVAMKQLAGVVRRTLGLKEEENYLLPAPIPQLKVPAEYPHWRVKYDSSGSELGRRLVHSLKEWSELARSEPGFNYAMPFEESKE